MYFFGFLPPTNEIMKKHENSKKITEKLTFGCKNLLLFSKGRWIWHKKYCKTIKKVEKLIIQIAYVILVKGGFM